MWEGATGFAKTSCKKLKEFMIEEKKTAKDYKARGFFTQGMQEGNHSKFFKKQLSNCKCTGCKK